MTLVGFTYCAGPCGRPLVTAGDAPLGYAKHVARGLCPCCYSHEQRRERAIDAPRRTRRRADVVEDTAELAGQGLTRTQIAQRLGLKPDSIYQAHRRSGVPCPV